MRRACRWAATSRPRPAGAAPRFLVWALKDPEGANLDRIQIVKGWTAADGTKEAIYDVGVRRRPQARLRRRSASYRGHRRRRLRAVERARRRRALDGVDRSGVRSGAARVLLRAGVREPDLPLEHVGGHSRRREAAATAAAHDPGARLVVADLVLALRRSTGGGEGGAGVTFALIGLFGCRRPGGSLPPPRPAPERVGRGARALALPGPVRDRVLRDRAGGDALPARRLAAVRGGRAGRDRRLADQRRAGAGCSCSSPACSATR